MLSVVILSPKEVIFEGEAKNIFLQGDEGEFELLPYHSPLVSVLRRGRIIIDREKYVPIKSGLARFNNNELVVMVEQ